MHVVVVVGGDLDDAFPSGSAQVGVRTHHDEDGSGCDEPVNELLGSFKVDIVDPSWGSLATVPARVVHIDVAAVLM